jgi:hypothetical protein
MLDVFSRYVVRWMIVRRESAALAQTFIRETPRHRTRASHHPRRSRAGDDVQALALLLADVGVAKLRPVHTSRVAGRATERRSTEAVAP